MFKIKIKADDGRELKASRDNIIYYKGADGEDCFWELERIAGSKHIDRHANRIVAVNKT